MLASHMLLSLRRQWGSSLACPPPASTALQGKAAREIDLGEQLP